MAQSAGLDSRALSGLDPEAALSTLFAHSPASIIAVSLDGRIAAANPAFCEMTGYSRNELLGTAADRLIHPGDQASCARDRAMAQRPGQNHCAVAYRYVHKAGMTLFVKGTVSAHRDTVTGATRWIIIQVAVSAMLPEPKTTASGTGTADRSGLHEKLSIALAAGRIGVWEADLLRDHYQWDARMHELYGLPEGTYDGTNATWTAFVHPADLARRTEEWREALIQATNAASEYRIFRKDGCLRHIHSLYRIFRNERGEPIRAIGANLDVTEYKLATERAIEEKERLTITLRSIGDAVICTDARSHITFMNPVAEKLTGWSSHEAAGLRLLDVFNIFEERSGDPIADPVKECLLRKAPFKMESGAMLVTRKGGALDIGMSAAPVSASGTDFIGAIIVFNDITDVRAMDKRMAHSALHDNLTGLPNRAAFMARMNEAVQQAREEDRHHVLCFIDLDRFKLVNDTGGHAAGDAVLRDIAKVIALSCTRSDIPARLGGDEFALLFRDCRADDAETRLRSIIAAIGDKEFWWEHIAFRIGASIGATEVTRRSPELSEILHEADKACYAAKEAGRGCLSFHGQRNGDKPAAHSLRRSIFPGWANLH